MDTTKRKALVRISALAGGTALMMLGLFGLALNRPAPDAPVLVTTAMGSATPTTTMPKGPNAEPTVAYVQSAAPSVKASFFGKG